mmetsp:Transcript_38547/g.46598  ORF Transcript_38547/g.46598 Transcript_38547/m.46598 type:complete len:149 (+) Transcript_38547:550-996(+)|eukprot:CAMPEP_0197861480 /NCGR_PEP_ID=MMETSP1438-20131217/37559_1 /TAXON_ID=1461541 /ORGANISM="Pterosperma sp., Strain CCMP1384" /LENGTH=148 /DNA_ID=CAMNT_0043478671 /DNA_START=539 /DNA_END=985 /DNA_ORIENTATION=+
MSDQIPKEQRITKVIDFRPSMETLNAVVILLDKGPVEKPAGLDVSICPSLVADSTASVHCKLWAEEVGALHPGDILKVTNGLFMASNHGREFFLKSGRKGRIEKIGEFCMLFSEAPNMSRVDWVPDPSNPKGLVPNFGKGGSMPLTPK